MRRTRTAALCLVLALLLTGPVLAADAGGPNDPLASLSYAKAWSQTVLQSAEASISTTLDPVYTAVSAYVAAHVLPGTGTQPVSLAAGGSITLPTGSSVMLLSGKAEIQVDAGAVANVTVGAAAGNGSLNCFQRYIVCENAAATVTASAAGLLLVDGTYTKGAGGMPFKDVSNTDWFYADVRDAVQMGLIDGMTASTFEPDGQLTVAQAIKLAACMHQRYTDGAVSLTSAGGKTWYVPYVTYAVANGVVDEDYGALTAAQYNAAVSRREFVRIFYGALPADEYAAVNTVADGAIPDVTMGDDCAAEIYAFYRAGILIGYEDGAFKPDGKIARREVAAILTRMFSADARQSVELK